MCRTLPSQSAAASFCNWVAEELGGNSKKELPQKCFAPPGSFNPHGPAVIPIVQMMGNKLRLDKSHAHYQSWSLPAPGATGRQPAMRWGGEKVEIKVQRSAGSVCLAEPVGLGVHSLYSQTRPQAPSPARTVPPLRQHLSLLISLFSCFLSFPI